jgi:ribonuclease HII
MLSSYSQGQYLEAGTDEVGRGCLCGPVVAAAVILPPDFHHPLITDSKKLTEKQRLSLDDIIRSQALAFAIAEVSAQKIDEINILQASFLAMHQALDGLDVRPELILVDGNKFKAYQDLPHHCIVKGDSKFFSIAAASILAKNYRDQLMKAQHDIYPHYAWHKNMGYPTKAHREGIVKHGITPLHRLSFKLLNTDDGLEG